MLLPLAEDGAAVGASRRIRRGALSHGRLDGGCQAGGMATVAPGHGIEVAITQSVPEIIQVLDVTDHASGTNPYF